MEEKITRKTLANCSAIEGFKQLNKIRKDVEELYKLIGVDDIKKKYAALAEKSDESQNSTLSKGFVSEILDAALETNIEKAVEVVGMMAFLSKEESTALTIDEVYEIVTDCMQSRAFMDFFSSVVSSVLKGTENT